MTPAKEDPKGFLYVALPGAPADEVPLPTDSYVTLPDVAVASRGLGLHIGSWTGALTVKGARHGWNTLPTVTFILEAPSAFAPPYYDPLEDVPSRLTTDVCCTEAHVVAHDCVSNAKWVTVVDTADENLHSEHSNEYLAHPPGNGVVKRCEKTMYFNVYPTDGTYLPVKTTPLPVEKVAVIEDHKDAVHPEFPHSKEPAVLTLKKSPQVALATNKHIPLTKDPLSKET